MLTGAKKASRRSLLTGLIRGIAVLFAAAGFPRLSSAAVNAVANTAGELRNRVRGAVIGRQDKNYESWRRQVPWQPYRADIHNRYPALIAQAQSEADVLAAVRFAKKQGLRVAVKSGGHSESGAFLRDDSLLIDLSRMQEVIVDRENRVFQAQPGVWARNLAEILRQHGLAFPVAHSGTVALGGYILAGGHGLNPDAWGTFSCFNIIAADVVTADGELTRCSAADNPELFWALRGAGPGFFGVVTRFYLRAYAYPTAMRSSVYGFPLNRLPEVVDWAQGVARAGIAKTELILMLIHNPDAHSDTPQQERFLCLFNPVVFAHSEREAQAVLAPLAAHPLAGQCLFKREQQPSSFETIYQRSYHQCFGRHSSDTMWTNSIDAAAPLLVKRFPTIPSAKSAIFLTFRTDPSLPEDAAASIIADAFIGCYSSWDADEDSARNVAWARQTIHALKELSAGHYINELNMFANPELIPECFSEAAWARLQQLKRQHDPDGLFHGYPEG